MIETRVTFCRFCHAACPLEVDVEITHGRERAIAVRGVMDDPLFEGYTCIKGRQLPDQHHAPDRLRRPLRRETEGSFTEVTSSDALDDIAARIRRIIDEHGPRAVASYTGTGAFQNAISMPAAVAFHQGIGSPSFYTSITIDQPAHLTARLRMGSWEAGWQNFRDADVLLAIGYNPLVSSYAPAGGLQGTNPFVTLRRAKARGHYRTLARDGKLLFYYERCNALRFCTLPSSNRCGSLLAAGTERLRLVAGSHC